MTGATSAERVHRACFPVDMELLASAGGVLGSDARLRWLVGGSGSGKSTVCRHLAARFDVAVIDMDARIYGAYHSRFTADRHPVSHAWSSADDGLSWLLGMSAEEFDAFNHASLPEYLDLLAEELERLEDERAIVVDGGISTPGLLAMVLEPARIACVRRCDLDPAQLWAQPGERAAMREAVLRLDDTGASWERFMALDACITETIAKECAQAAIAVCEWDAGDSADEVADRVAALWSL